METTNVPLYHFKAMHPGVPPIAVHNEGNVLGDRSRAEHGDHGALKTGQRLVSKP